MNVGAAGERFIKAQRQNHYENNKCDLRKKEIEKDRHRSLFMITKSRKDVQNSLRDIKASTGYSKGDWPGLDTLSSTQQGITSYSADNSECMGKLFKETELTDPGDSELKSQQQAHQRIWNTHSALHKEHSSVFGNEHVFGEVACIGSSQQAISSKTATDCTDHNVQKSRLRSENILTNVQSRKNALGDVVEDADNTCSSDFLCNSDEAAWEKDAKHNIRDARPKNKATQTISSDHPVTLLLGKDGLPETGKENVHGLRSEQLQHSSAAAWNPTITETIAKCDEFRVKNREREHSNNTEAETSAHKTFLSYSGTPKTNGECDERLKTTGHLKHLQHKAEICVSSMHLPRLQPNALIGMEHENSSLDQQHIVFSVTQSSNPPCATEKVNYHLTRFLIPEKNANISENEAIQCLVSLEVMPVACVSSKRSQSAPMSRFWNKTRGKSASRLNAGSRNSNYDKSSEDVFRNNTSSATVLTCHHQQVFNMRFAEFVSNKSKVRVILSKAEKKKALEQLVLDYNKPVDKTILEKARQNKLQDKITAFIASLEQQSKNDTTL